MSETADYESADYQQLLSSARDAAVLLHTGAPLEFAPVRRVDGRRMTDLSGVYDEFARAWRFPGHFGRNKDAFDDCMRDLAGSVLITEIDDATRLLVDAPGQLRWFADSLEFYRDHYRGADPPAVFTVVLRVDPAQSASVRRRWHRIGVEPVPIGS